MKKLSLLIAVCMLILSLPFGSCFAEGVDIDEFRFAIEYVYADGRMIIQCDAVNGSSPYTFGQEIVFSEWLSVGGWMANDEGIAKLQYSVDEETWYDCEKTKLTKRSDLADAGIPYEDGHATAGFGAGTNLIPAYDIIEDNSFLAVRAVTLEGNFVEFIYFDDVSVVGPGEEGAEKELVYNTYLDNVTDGYISQPAGVNQPSLATIETESGKPVSVRGWAVSNYGISKVVYTIDDGETYDCTDVYTKRPDVMNAYPVYTDEQGNTDHVGFGLERKYISLPKTGELPAGIYVVKLYALSADGSKQYNISVLELVIDGGGDDIISETPVEEATDLPAATPEQTDAPTDVSSVTDAPESTADTSSGLDKGCGGYSAVPAVMISAALPAVFLKRKKR